MGATAVGVSRASESTCVRGVDKSIASESDSSPGSLSVVSVVVRGEVVFAVRWLWSLVTCQSHGIQLGVRWNRYMWGLQKFPLEGPRA